MKISVTTPIQIDPEVLRELYQRLRTQYEQAQDKFEEMNHLKVFKHEPISQEYIDELWNAALYASGLVHGIEELLEVAGISEFIIEED